MVLTTNFTSSFIHLTTRKTGKKSSDGSTFLQDLFSVRSNKSRGSLLKSLLLFKLPIWRLQPKKIQVWRNASPLLQAQPSPLLISLQTKQYHASLPQRMLQLHWSPRAVFIRFIVWANLIKRGSRWWLSWQKETVQTIQWQTAMITAS